MTRAIRGVNLGGWLLLEKWMTPELFDGTDAVDEYTFMQSPGAREKLRRHRENFITEADFAWLGSHGVQAIRIPVGYWILEDAAPFVEGVHFLDWAFDMAQKYHLQVLIDLHGLPGSQNGNDHSGRIGAAQWYTDICHRQASIAIAVKIAKRYQTRENFWGLEIINEPRTGILQRVLRRYYRDAFAALAPILPAHTHFIYSDAWSPRLLSLALPRRKHSILMDVHLYHMATLAAKKHSLQWFYHKLEKRVRMLKRLQKRHPIIIGEWSGVISHETIGHLSPTEQTKIFQHYTRLQQDLYDGFAGWFYWSYKTSGPNQWNFRSQIEAGNMPALMQD